MNMLQLVDKLVSQSVISVNRSADSKHWCAPRADMTTLPNKTKDLLKLRVRDYFVLMHTRYSRF